MEFDLYAARRKNARESKAGVNYDDVKSGSDIQLTALEGQLQKAEEKCNFIKKRLDYMKMLYQSTGPTGASMAVQLAFAISPRSTQINTPRIPPISMIAEDVDDCDVGREMQNDHEIEENVVYSSKSRKLESAVVKENAVRRSSENLIIEEWNEKSLDQVYSRSSDKFYNSFTPESIDALPKKSDFILELTSKQEKPARSPFRENAVKARIISSTHENKNEANQTDESPPRIMRMKKRRMKLKTSNSRSTTASKYAAILPESKHVRKNKRRVYRVKETQQIGDAAYEKKKPSDETNREVVEIYHNRAIHSAQTLSEASNSRQQLKITPGLEVSNSPVEIKPGNNKKCYTVKKNEETSHPKENILEHNAHGNLPSKGELSNFTKNHYEELQSQPIRAWCDSLSLPNYQQPTFASKLKRVDRCYLTARFTLRNIPFVVGTSLTPSFNLGLNIQQTLSLMKTKQPALAPEMRPFFIKKIGEELNPLICMQESARNHQLKIPEDIENNPVIEKFKKTHDRQLRNNRESSRNLSIQRKQEEMKQAGTEPPMCPDMNSRSPEIKNVFLRLHRKFEEMQDKYEKLQEQAIKSKDKTLEKKLRELEEELEAKESEINAVVGLYNEVMALRSQINYVYNQRNSLLCISDDYSGKIPSRINPMMMGNYRRNNVSLCGVKTASTSTRLTGLLRQIQLFQQQLSAS